MALLLERGQGEDRRRFADAVRWLQGRVRRGDGAVQVGTERGSELGLGGGTGLDSDEGLDDVARRVPVVGEGGDGPAARLELVLGIRSEPADAHPARLVLSSQHGGRVG